MAQARNFIPTYWHDKFVFHLSPLVDSQEDQPLTYGGPVAAILPTMPYDGSIVGIGVDASAAASSGVSSFDAVVATVQQGADVSLAAAATRAFGAFREGTYKFNAGDALGASYTSGALGTNANVQVYVYVLYEKARPA